jgi:hypothetical protein
MQKRTQLNESQVVAITPETGIEFSGHMVSAYNPRAELSALNQHLEHPVGPLAELK